MSYKTYENYKETEIKWANLVPRHWNINKLKRIFKFEKGKNAQLFTEEYINSIEGSFPVYSGQTKNEGILGYIDSFEYNFDKNVILVTTVGAKAMTTFRINGKLSLSQNCALIKLKSGKDISDYYFYLCKILFKYERGLIPDIMQPSLRITDLNTYDILQPSREEQKAIAKYLDKKTLAIDEIIYKNKELITLLEEKKTTLINQVVTKGLNQNTPMKDSEIEWIGCIPEHWDVLKLKFLTTKIGSGKTPKGGSAIYVNEGIPLLRSQNVHFDSIRWDDVVYIPEEINRNMLSTIVKNNDVLLNITGASIGRCFYVEGVGMANVNQHVCIIRPNKRIFYKFLNYFLQSDSGQTQILRNQNGSSREGLNFEDISNFDITLPLINEQIDIVNYLEVEINKIYKLISKIKENIHLLEEYKNSLIYHVVTGKIDVRDEV